MPLEPEFKSVELTDSLFSFPQGMHAGISPILLPKTQLAFLTNGTVRGDFAVHRPAFRRMVLSFGDTTTQRNFQTTKFQGAGMLNPIAASDCVLASIGGNIFQITPGTGGTASVINADPPNDSNPSTPNQVWIFQTERWAIINDGQSIPMINDGVSTRRANTGGFLLTVQNMTDPNAGSNYPAGTAVLIPANASYGSLHASNTGFCPPPGAGVNQNVTYSWPSGLAAGTNVLFLPSGGVPPVGSQLIIGNDLWTVKSSGSFQNTGQLPCSGPFSTFFFATNNNAIANGTSYVNGTNVFAANSAQTVGATPFTVPAIGNSQQVHVSQSYIIPIPGAIFINGFAYSVTAINTTSATAAEMPPGRMGCNAGGRTWMCLPDGKSYIASDLTGDQSSGTVNFNYTDAVLHFTENTLIAGGGAFRVPSDAGNIAAMLPTATLDSSLGTGPVEIITPTMIWANNSPTDRTTWQNVTYPIQSVSLLGAGGLSQWSTVNANSDTMMRSLDGIRSLVLARRDFDVWGNVPYSEEIEPVIVSDNVNLLQFSSAIVFDNRLLMTANPQQHAQGVYHDRIIALNFDPVSSLTGKAPSVYDGIWTGINVLQLVTGTFNNVWRAFAFVLNLSGTSPVIEFWEILLQPPDPDYLPINQLIQWSDPNQNFDNGNEPIPMSIIFPLIDFGQKDPKNMHYLQLNNGEIYVDHMSGTVEFQMWYKADDYPLWTLWFQWLETATPTVQGFPKFRPRMGLGTPSGDPCDAENNRPLREGYRFQLKLIIIGNARFKGGKFSAVTIPQPKYAPPCPLTSSGVATGVSQETIGQTGLASPNPQALIGPRGPPGPPGPPGGPGPPGPPSPGGSTDVLEVQVMS